MRRTMFHATPAVASAAGGRSEPSHRTSGAISRKRSREEAEERRWQLEWDRRNVED